MVNINVESELGKGTMFGIYLPLIEQEVEKARGAIYTLHLGMGQRRSWQRKDGEDVRNLTGIALERNGYKVRAALDNGNRVT